MPKLFIKETFRPVKLYYYYEGSDPISNKCDFFRVSERDVLNYFIYNEIFDFGLK